MATTLENAASKESVNWSKGLGWFGTLLGAAGTATGITALASKVPKNGCGCNGRNWDNGCGNGPTPFQAWGKACEDEVALTAAIYQGRITELNERFADRQVIDREMFGLYKNQIDADFGLYKNQRDQFDVLAGRIGDLEKQVAVNTAIRPYQDALIQCDINNARKDAQFDLFRRTCRMIEGELVLPDSPTVTGYPSYGRCAIPVVEQGSPAAQVAKAAVK